MPLQMELRFFILRRLLLLIPTTLGLTLVTFILEAFMPISVLTAPYYNPHSTIPRAIQMQHAATLLGLNLPLPLRYFVYLWRLLHGNLGIMNLQGYPGNVTEAIQLAFPNTITLAIFATVLSIAIAIPLGTYIGARPNTLADGAGRVFSLSGYAMPAFWLGLLLQIGLGKNIIEGNPVGIFPPFGSVPHLPIPPPSWYESGFSHPTHLFILDALIHGNFALAGSAFMYVVLPVLTLTYGILAGVLRFVRAGMVDESYSEYVKTARAKGVPERLVIKKHVRKNALIPTVTVLGLLFAFLLGGVVLVETVFQYPGIGLLAVNSALQFQIYGVIGTTLVFGILLMIANLIVDVAYALIDPRIRY